MTVVVPASPVAPSASLPAAGPASVGLAPGVGPVAATVLDRAGVRARPRRTGPRAGATAVLDLTTGLVALPLAGLAAGGLPAGVSVALVALWALVSRAARRSAGAPTLVVLSASSPGAAAAALRTGALIGMLCWAASTLAPEVADDRALLAFVATATALTVAVGLLRHRRRAATRVVLVGGPASVASMLAELDRTPGHGLEVAAACLCSDPTEPDVALHHVPDPGITLARSLEALPGILADHAHDAVLALPGPGLAPRDLRALGWQLESLGTPLLVGTGLIGAAPRRTTSARAGDIGLLHLHPARRRGRLVHAWERVSAAVALVVLAPVLLVLAAAVRHDSPGPAVFRQTRVGRDGRTFVMLKLRTMTVGSEHLVAELRDVHGVDQMLFKMTGDPRVTALGRWLRRYSLDELPQLVNVVRGHMSLVGPRPALPGEVQAYDDYPRRRLAVRPGLTGLWQVSGRSDLSFEDAVRLDLDYVDNWSPTRDLRILALTVGAVLGHRGAY